MGKIYDTPTWVDDIYLIEPYDPVMGGENGIDNIQAKQLANRTAFLRSLLLSEHYQDGSHNLANPSVVSGANIQELKLGLVKGTTEIKGLIDDCTEADANLNSLIADHAGINGSLGASISKAVPLSWAYSERAFDFDMFVPGMTLLDTQPQALLETIAGDESIDVTDSSLMSVGKTYVVCNSDGSMAEEFVVSEILTLHRIRATQPLTITRSSGLVGRSTWRISDGTAYAKNEATYYTRQILILEDNDFGKVVIRLLDDQSSVTVLYRFNSSEDWQEAPVPDLVTRVSGYLDAEYVIPGGLLELKLVASTGPGVEEVTIDNICVLPYEAREMVSQVKRPMALYPLSFHTEVSLTPRLSASDYRSLYGVPMQQAQFQVSTAADFATIVYEADSLLTPYVDIPESTLVASTSYYWRCRYQDTDGVWSPWSYVTPFSTGTALGMVYPPSISAPAQGALDVAVTGYSFTSSSFAASVSDTFESVQWQFSIGSSFTTIFFDSGEVAGATSYTYPAGTPLGAETTYYCRVRYKGAALGWSEWSQYIYFTTAP